MLCVPAKVTYCLQPLDVYVFSNIKGSMRQSFQERNIMTQSGQVSFDSSITVYCRAVEKVLLSRSWAHAFERLGLTGTQENVSARLQRYMAVDSIYTVSKDFPTLGELQSCFPLRFDIPIDDVFGTVSLLAEEKKLWRQTLRIHPWSRAIDYLCGLDGPCGPQLRFWLQPTHHLCLLQLTLIPTTHGQQQCLC